MPVTRKGAGGADASARVRFSGLYDDDNERKRRDERAHKQTRKHGGPRAAMQKADSRAKVKRSARTA